MTLLTNLQSVEENILDINYSRLSEILLFGESSYNDTKNASILNSIILYMFDTERLYVPLTNYESYKNLNNPFIELPPHELRQFNPD